jgi:two-component system, chemotaxis family, CheB/CheR fusion protein
MTTELDRDFAALLNHLREKRGFDFTAYKQSTLLRRVRKRMEAVGAEDYDGYVDYLEVHQDEFTPLFNAILINVTGFFRDQPAWEYLEREIVPRLIESRQPAEPIRVWSAGCSTGEEAYTIAMILAEALGPEAYSERVKIYATDADEDALAKARHATYSARALEPVPPALVNKYFERQDENRCVFRKEFRRSIIFGRHDLLQDTPISRIDLLACRNTLMYFNSDAQARVLSRFRYALNDGGYAFLGRAETLLAHPHLFTPTEHRYRVFTRAEAGSQDRRGNGKSATHERNFDDGGGRDLLHGLAFRLDPIAQVIIDTNGVLTMANERAFSLFRLSSRDIGRPVGDIELSYRPVDLRPLIADVMSQKKPMTLTEVPYPSDGSERWFDVQLMPLLGNEQEIVAVKASFVETTRARELAEELHKSRLDLEAAYEELQSSNEELETTNEELQSTVEELETTNEELQSTNEELENMNRELQLTNQELESMNETLKQQGIQLNHANAFLGSILTSLNMGVAVIDQDLAVRVWNRQAEDLWGLRSDEVQGHVISSLDIGLDTKPLVQPIRDCLRGELESFETVQPATNRRGRHIACRVNLAPFIDGNQRIIGVVTLMEEVKTNEGNGTPAQA